MSNASGSTSTPLLVRPVAGGQLRSQDFTALLKLNDQTTTFLDLNDDCIIEVLSMDCLSAVDLCSIAETCRRLKDIARLVFRREHKECTLKSLSEENSQAVKRILTHFGSEIRHWQIRADKYSSEWSGEILDSVTEYCSSDLHSLCVFKYNFSDSLAVHLRKKFNDLPLLRLARCTITLNSKESFADCESFIRLDVGNYSDGVLEKTFPKLQHLRCNYGVNSVSLEPFISRHMNLKSIKIWRSEPSVLQLIAQCKRLEMLKCCISENATLDLSNLGNLRELEIHCCRQIFSIVATGLENLQFLEHLHLYLAYVDPGFVRTLSQLQRLRVLKLGHCIELQFLNEMGDLNQLTTLEILSFCNDRLDVVHLVQRLPKLNWLKVAVRGFEIDLAKYMRIVDVVRQRADPTKLTFKLICKEDHKYDNLLADFNRNAHLVEMMVHYCCW